MKLEKCPLCGATDLDETPEFIYCRKCETGTVKANWNRLAMLVHKGLMFEWLEGQGFSEPLPGCEYARMARDWWRERRKK